MTNQVNSEVSRKLHVFQSSIIVPTHTVRELKLIRSSVLSNDDTHFLLTIDQIKQCVFKKFNVHIASNEIKKLPHFAVVVRCKLNNSLLTKQFKKDRLNFIISASPNVAFLSIKSLLFNKQSAAASGTRSKLRTNKKIQVYSQFDRYNLKWTQKQLTEIPLESIEITQTEQLYYLNKLDIFQGKLGINQAKRSYHKKQ